MRRIMMPYSRLVLYRVVHKKWNEHVLHDDEQSDNFGYI